MIYNIKTWKLTVVSVALARIAVATVAAPAGSSSACSLQMCQELSWSALSGCLAPATMFGSLNVNIALDYYYFFGSKTLTFWIQSECFAQHQSIFPQKSSHVSEWPGWSGLVAGGGNEAVGLPETRACSWNLFIHFSCQSRFAGLLWVVFLNSSWVGGLQPVTKVQRWWYRVIHCCWIRRVDPFKLVWFVTWSAEKIKEGLCSNLSSRDCCWLNGWFGFLNGLYSWPRLASHAGARMSGLRCLGFLISCSGFFSLKMLYSSTFFLPLTW